MKSIMTGFIDEIRYDLNFLKSHTLQPQWYKKLKGFILIGFIVGYFIAFGLPKTLLFLTTFFILCGLIHFTYRAKTHRWTQTWLDFVVIREHNETRMKRIGKFYYPAILISAIISLVISQILI